MSLSGCLVSRNSIRMSEWRERTWRIAVHLEKVACREGELCFTSSNVARRNVRYQAWSEEVFPRTDVAEAVQVRVKGELIWRRAVVEDEGRGDELYINVVSASILLQPETRGLTMCSENSFAWQEKPALTISHANRPRPAPGTRTLISALCSANK